mmetsp:Transcript_4193/g.26576  ORF Transcript_4193/g.26576 Transcript_4193/m.26576 type:complete len:113 (+) Transcript_4193:1637-1975(+)
MSKFASFQDIAYRATHVVYFKSKNVYDCTSFSRNCTMPPSTCTAIHLFRIQACLKLMKGPHKPIAPQIDPWPHQCLHPLVEGRVLPQRFCGVCSSQDMFAQSVVQRQAQETP